MLCYKLSQSVMALDNGNMEPSRKSNFLLVDSGFLKCIWQERKPGRSHIAFFNLASEVMQHHSGQEILKSTPKFKNVDWRPHLLMEEHQAHCKKNIWDVHKLVWPSLENIVCHSQGCP